jgi:ribonuclease BN (tRNA processing enzyme)
MSRHFDPHLVNDPFGDPALYVQLVFERRALLFDLGDLSRLSPRQLLRISDVFISHRHMDHFSGFDQFLRCLLGREKVVGFYGPPGLIEGIEHKLKAYTWNLKAILGGSPEETPIDVAWADPSKQRPRSLPLGTLTKEIMRVSAGRKIAYVVDCAFTDANADRIVSLAKDADILFIEAAFLDEDRSRAADRRHLTVAPGRDAGGARECQAARDAALFPPLSRPW